MNQQQVVIQMHRSREFTLHSPQDKYSSPHSVDVYGGFPQALSPETLNKRVLLLSFLQKV